MYIYLQPVKTFLYIYLGPRYNSNRLHAYRVLFRLPETRKCSGTREKLVNRRTPVLSFFFLIIRTAPYPQLTTYSRR